MSWNEKVTKTENLRKCFVWYFGVWRKREKSVCTLFTTVCNSSLTYTTYKPSHRSHTIIPLSNHHTIIIPKSHNLRNICISKIVWFRYDYGMMVWKWYDWMIVVWWFVSCVCEGVQLKKMQTVVNKVHTLFSRFLQTPKYHTKHFLKFSVFVTFSFHDMTREFPEDLWRPGH